MKYIEKNVNHKNKKTTDCVVRALCEATSKDYKVVAKELFELWMSTGLMVDDKKCYEKFLENNGFIKQKMPRKLNNKKYTIEEFIDKFGKDNVVYVINVVNHVTCVKNKNLIDIWDCSKEYVGNYYTKIKE